jgi:hypothetical protein
MFNGEKAFFTNATPARPTFGTTCPLPAVKAVRLAYETKNSGCRHGSDQDAALCLPGGIEVVSERNEGETASAAFKFKNVSQPAKLDAAEKATFTLVDGQADTNGGDLTKLHDGRLPREEDQPSENFFFRPGTAGGRIRIDLGTNLVIKQINTYSWHPGTRAPQVYRLYGGDGSAPGFNAEPKRDTDPNRADGKLSRKLTPGRRTARAAASMVSASWTRTAALAFIVICSSTSRAQKMMTRSATPFFARLM